MRSATSVVGKTTKLLGLTAAAALAVTGLGAGTANAAPLAGGSLECATVLPSVDGVPAVPEGKFARDNNNPTAAEVAAMEAEFQKRMRELGIADIEIREPIEIPVVWHVIREDLTVAGGNIPRTDIRAQIKVLNHAYRGKGESEPGARTPFKFSLDEVTRTTNEEWFNNSDPRDPDNTVTEMKEETRVGGPETLNSWTADLINSPPGGLLGFATFPSDYDAQPALDGVVNTFQSLPNAQTNEDPPAYDDGDTATHEIGHWLGLFHTFQDGCSGGDLIADTPAEAEPYFGECPPGTTRDTCEGDPGNDPIENFMDYSNDVCLDRFTMDQRERMIDQWFTFRNGGGEG